VKDTATAWLSQEITWYAGQQLKMDLITGVALWHRDGEDPLPIRWVLLRDPSGKRSPFALFCTDPTVPMLQIVAWYVSRWNIEVTFEEVRAHLGLETQRQWSTLAIARTTPCPARDCLASWCSWPMLCILTICQHAKLPGIPKPNPPLSMRWPQSVGICRHN
jgi:hypothetical protein